jgi:hypothetical protein
MVYKKKTHYNEWEFVYDPIAERMMAQVGIAGGSGLPASGSQGSQSSFGNGLSSGNPGIGLSGVTPGGGPPTNTPVSGPGNPPVWSPNGNLPVPQ